MPAELLPEVDDLRVAAAGRHLSWKPVGASESSVTCGGVDAGGGSSVWMNRPNGSSPTRPIQPALCPRRARPVATLVSAPGQRPAGSGDRSSGPGVLGDEHGHGLAEGQDIGAGRALVIAALQGEQRGRGRRRRGWRASRVPATVISTVSPGRMRARSPGAPVSTTSPGCRVINEVRYTSTSTTSRARSRVEAPRRARPLRLTVISASNGSRSVSIHGPSGVNVSWLLASVHRRSGPCAARAVTSLATRVAEHGGQRVGGGEVAGGRPDDDGELGLGVDVPDRPSGSGIGAAGPDHRCGRLVERLRRQQAVGGAGVVRHPEHDPGVGRGEEPGPGERHG